MPKAKNKVVQLQQILATIACVEGYFAGAPTSTDIVRIYASQELFRKRFVSISTKMSSLLVPNMM